jgi:hypothetical protein
MNEHTDITHVNYATTSRFYTDAVDAPKVEGTRPAEYIIVLASRFIELRERRDKAKAELSYLEEAMMATQAEMVEAAKEGGKVDPRIAVIYHAMSSYEHEPE